MNHKKTVIIFSIATIFLVVILIFLPTIRSGFYSILSRGAVSKNEATAVKCNTQDTICVVENGKVVSKKITPKKESEEKDQNIRYAINVTKAVQAIREYTKIPNLDVSLLEGSTPEAVSYYCTKDNKCWAVDNETYKVIPYAK